MKDQIRETFGRHRARFEREVVELTSRLVACRTVNAGRERLGECPGQEVPGEETQVVDVLRPVLEGMGATCSVHALDPRRANLLAVLGDRGPTLAVGCHSDVVPPGEGWDTDPFQVVVRDGRLYGRGVLDNKGPLAASVAAMRLLRECNVPLDGRFMVAAIASEEHRDAGEPDPGIEHLVERGVLRPDYAVIPDIGENMRRIDVAEKGRMEIRVRSLGRQAHGSTPEQGVNAVNAMARLLTRLEGRLLPHEAHPVLGGPTMNLGLIRGGVAANVVPGDCVSTFDIRWVPGQTQASILEVFQAAATEAGGSYEFTVGAVSQPHAIPADHPLVGAIQGAAEPVLGFRPQPFGMGGGTFAKTFNLAGIPAVGFGPGDDAAFHVANESIEIRQLVDFVELLALVAVDLLGTRA